MVESGKQFFFQDMVALVSGSSQGIGKAIAIALGNEGAKIVINGRDRKKLKATNDELTAMGLEVIAVTADVRDPAQCQYLIRQVMARFGRLDILVNNAGVSSRGELARMADLVFEVVMDTNFNGAAYLSKYAIPHLVRTRGHLIFINSAGGLRGMPYNVAYTASKMAQSALAQALNIELKGTGVHVGIAYVGFTENDPRKKILDVDGSWIYLPRRTNVRLAKPESVARSIVRMIRFRKRQITLTGLGKLTGFLTRYFPWLAEWILTVNRNKIKLQYTLIGGEKVNLSHLPEYLAKIKVKDNSSREPDEKSRKFLHP
jgi:NAD(P)-dependent dehydrogenase (short-subunit alcohol dehydrogenase family)